MSTVDPITIALLWVLGTGATAAEAGPLLAEYGLAADAAHIETTIATLHRDGYLEAQPAQAGENGAPGALRLTARGRQAMLAFLGEWTVTVARFRHEESELERRRTDLLSTLSHELRTPLTLILTSSGLLLDGDPEPAMRRRLLQNVKQSADRMSSLVTDVLDLARLQSHRLELQLRQVDLGELVTGTVSLLHPLLQTKQQTVRVELPSPAPVVPGDFPRLERVLLNLLGNAHKFAPAGTAITVSVSANDIEAIIGIADAGPGITPEAMPHLFEQFFTDRTSSSRHNIGAGMGLPIAKGIVETHGGRIWVDSQVGVGTTVWVALPTTWRQEEAE